MKNRKMLIPALFCICAAIFCSGCSGGGSATFGLKKVIELEYYERFQDAAFSPDGKTIMVRFMYNSPDEGTSGAHMSEYLTIYDVTTGEELKSWSGSDFGQEFGYGGGELGPVEYNYFKIAISPDGKKIVTGDRSGVIKLWDAENNKELQTFSGHNGRVYFAAFSPDGKKIISSYEAEEDEATVTVWDAANGKELQTFPKNGGGIVSPNGKILATSNGGTITLWDIDSGKEQKTFSESDSYIYSGAFSPDGKKIAAGVDNKIIIWDAASGKKLQTLSGHEEAIGTLAFNPNGRQIVSGSYDGIIKIWDAASGKELQTLSGHTGGVGAAFSSDGKQIVSGSSDSIRIWGIVEKNPHAGTWESQDGRYKMVVSDASLLLNEEGEDMEMNGNWVYSGNTLTFYDEDGDTAAVFIYDKAAKTLSLEDEGITFIRSKEEKARQQPRKAGKVSAKKEGVEWGVQEMVEYLEAVLPGFEYEREDRGTLVYGPGISFTSTNNPTILMYAGKSEDDAKSTVDALFLNDVYGISWGRFTFVAKKKSDLDFLKKYFNQ